MQGDSHQKCFENHTSSTKALNIGSLSSTRKKAKKISFTPKSISIAPNSSTNLRGSDRRTNTMTTDKESSFKPLQRPAKVKSFNKHISFSSSIKTYNHILNNITYDSDDDNITIIDNNEEEKPTLPPIENFESYTNMEMISDFYDYTEECIKMILELKKETIVKSSVKYSFNLPKEDKDKKIAIFDLDETLIHCTGKDTSNAQYIIDVTLPSKQTVKIGINLRPNWKEALDIIKKDYVIAVFTASYQSYADAVLNFIDPNNKYFTYRLYRHHCSKVTINNTPYYIKDLSIIDDVDIKKLLMIDNSVFSFAFHLDNGVLVVPYYDSDKDSELVLLAHYFNAIAKAEDVREVNRKNINMNFYVEKAKKAMEEGSDSSGSESVKTEEVKSSRIPSEITLREVKKKKSSIKKRSKKKEKLYLIGKELNDKIECIRQKLRRDEKTPIQISNYL